VYGVLGLSQIGQNQLSATNGSGFMISPGVIATAGHMVHVSNDPGQPTHQHFEVIRVPDIGQPAEAATLLAEDPARDLALLRVINPRTSTSVTLDTSQVVLGTSCGSVGFPLARVVFGQAGRQFHLIERFQAASVSAFHRQPHPSGRVLAFYETDALMYSGSSGCPGFLVGGHVFAMHVASMIDRSAPTAATSAPATPQETRLSISMWVPAEDIRDFASSNGVVI
jgi:S1-C subfamily serine protease